MLRPTVSRSVGQSASRPVCLGVKHSSEAYDQILIYVSQLWFFDVECCLLTRGLACHLQLLLALVSAVILEYKSRGTRDDSLLSQIRDFHFRRLLRLAGLQWRYSNPPPHGIHFATSLFLSNSEPESESYVTTDGRSASLSWNEAPIWGLRPNFCFCQIVPGVPMWGAFSDERTGLSFTIAAGPRQRSHSRVQVQWDSRPYFTVSDLSLPRFIVFYDSQGYGGGIRPRLHTRYSRRNPTRTLPF
jgi:hypothetical protein